MTQQKQTPDRNLAMELVRVTEAAALAASRWVGRGDKEGADGAAVDAMRIILDSVPMDGVVVIGEGEKDEAPMLYNGERIGDGSPPETDIAVDPVEGTSLTASGIGGTPEGGIAAAAMKCMGGELQGRLWPQNDAERAAAIAAGYDLDRVLSTDDLVRGDNCFFAVTGITDGDVLKGVHYDSQGATTQSLVMRSRSGTVRLVDARHKLEKLDRYAAVTFS